MPVDVGLHSARAIVFTGFDFQRIIQIDPLALVSIHTRQQQFPWFLISTHTKRQQFPRVWVSTCTRWQQFPWVFSFRRLSHFHSLKAGGKKWFQMDSENSFHRFLLSGNCPITIDRWQKGVLCFPATSEISIIILQHCIQHIHCTIMINAVGHFIHQHSMHNQDYHSSFQFSLTRGRPDFLPVLCIESAHYAQWNLSPALCTFPQPAKSKKNYFNAFLLLYLFLHFLVSSCYQNPIQLDP